MGILTFFDQLFSFGGQSDEDKANTRESVSRAVRSLDIDVALAAHENWKYRLYASLESGKHDDLKPETIACDHCCDFGKWIYSDGDQHLGRFAAFGELKATHQMFHYTASNVATLIKAGKAPDAHKLLEGDFARLSHRINAILQDLKSLSRST